MTGLPVTDTIAEREREVVEEFAFFDDWADRYAHLIEQAKLLPLIEDAYKTDAYRVRGCQSQVWLRAVPAPAPAEAGGERLHFRADSDAIITKGLIALLLRVLDGQPAAAIARADLGFLEAIGLREHLSPGRANGLAAMVRLIRTYAAEHAA
jgi:cysteine desulfuration protein SufE